MPFSIGVAERIALAAALALVSGCSESAPAGPRVVDIKAGDGTTLKGTLFAARGPGPGILLLHQCDDHRTVWDSLGVRLAAAGMTALSVDYRGYGESGGTPHDKLSNAELTKQQADVWPSDVDSAFAFLSRQTNVTTKRVGAAGGSCGVNEAVQLARRHSNVRALALLAGGTDRDGRLFLAADGAPPIFAAAAADDQYGDFVKIMSWIFGVSRSSLSRLAQYPDGGHAAVIFKKYPGLADTIATWFAAVLPDKAGPLPTTNGVALDPAILTALHDIDQPGGAAAMAKRLGASKGPLVPESFVNQLGYEHMLTNDHATAIDLMTLNTLQYPHSANTMDSLGDAYLAAGDTAKMLDAARRTLALLPSDAAATPQQRENLKNIAQGKLKQFARR